MGPAIGVPEVGCAVASAGLVVFVVSLSAMVTHRKSWIQLSRSG